LTNQKDDRADAIDGQPFGCFGQQDFVLAEGHTAVAMFDFSLTPANRSPSTLRFSDVAI
jgi:hypothetical protein